jgi:hypothetical protein
MVAKEPLLDRPKRRSVKRKAKLVRPAPCIGATRMRV